MMRYAVQMILHERIAAYHFPWATFLVNIAGSLLIGLFYSMSAKLNLSDEMRLLLTAGLCGGFTTFSTFSYDNLAMLRQGEWLTCAVYIVVSIAGGIGACLLGASVLKS